MKIKREYKAYLYDNDQLIDETCIDEPNEEFALGLFKDECGHTNLSDNAYVTIEPAGFYDSETGCSIIIEELNKEDRINPIDDMKQFKIVYFDGEETIIEAKDLVEAMRFAEDFNRDNKVSILLRASERALKEFECIYQDEIDNPHVAPVETIKELKRAINLFNRKGEN